MASGIPLNSLMPGVVWSKSPSGLLSVASGRSLYVYVRGSTTPVQVYSDQALTVAMSQPLATDADGNVPGYVAAERQIDFYDVLSGQRAQAEPLSVADLVGSDGKVGGAGSLGLPSSVVSVNSGSNVPAVVWAPAPSGDTTGATDSAAVQAFIDALTGTGAVILLKAGTYWGNLTMKPQVRLRGCGRWMTTWKAPATFAGIVLEGLDYATLTGKTKATGDYALGCPGTGAESMTVDGNNTASNCIGWWASYWYMDDLRCQKATGDNIQTEFTDVDSYTDPNQQTDGFAGRVYSILAGGWGWRHRGPHDTRVDTYLAHNNTLGDFQTDAVTNGYTGGADFKYFNGFDQGTAGTCVQVLNGSYFGMGSGQITYPSNGVGLDLSSVCGSCNAIGIVAGAGDGTGTGVHLRGIGHQLHLRATNNGDVLLVDGCKKCYVGIEGGSTNKNIINYVSEGGPNTFLITADIGTGDTLLTGISNAAGMNTLTTAIVSANGAGGNFGTVKLPDTALYNSNGYHPSLPASSATLAYANASAVTYGTTVSTDASAITLARLTVTDTVAFTIANPTGMQSGQLLTYRILNSSGGVMGTITWGSAFKLAGAFTNPANGKVRTIVFAYSAADGAWYEVGRAAADI